MSKSSLEDILNRACALLGLVGLVPLIDARAVSSAKHEPEQVDPKVEYDRAEQHLHRPIIPLVLSIRFTHFQSLWNLIRDDAVESTSDAPVHVFVVVDGPGDKNVLLVVTCLGLDLSDESTAGGGNERGLHYVEACAWDGGEELAGVG